MAASDAGLAGRVRTLWFALRTERASPSEIFWTVFLGATMGCAPLPWVRHAIAIGLASAARTNRLWAWVASKVTGNLLVTAWIMLAEVQVAHRLREGTWLALTLAEIRARGVAELLADGALGFVILGPPIGLVVALVALRWRSRSAALGTT